MPSHHYRGTKHPVCWAAPRGSRSLWSQSTSRLLPSPGAPLDFWPLEHLPPRLGPPISLWSLFLLGEGKKPGSRVGHLEGLCSEGRNLTAQASDSLKAARSPQLVCAAQGRSPLWVHPQHDRGQFDGVDPALLSTGLQPLPREHGGARPREPAPTQAAGGAAG